MCCACSSGNSRGSGAKPRRSSPGPLRPQSCKHRSEYPFFLLRVVSTNPPAVLENQQLEMVEKGSLADHEKA